MLLGALAIGCGPRPAPYVGTEEAPVAETLETCAALYGHPGQATRLPACVRTARGVMPVERTYLPGVVACELGRLTTEPAALEAQAVAARTYLLAHLERRGPDALIPVTARFQCWKSPGEIERWPLARAAAAETVDVVMTYGGQTIGGNYAAGARKLDDACLPHPPGESGYDGYESWTEMRDEFVRRRAAGNRIRHSGVAWTEILVTRNEGRSGDDVVPTAFAPPGPTNRGALSQNGAMCLARRGLDGPGILRYFYGDDIELTPRFGNGSVAGDAGSDGLDALLERTPGTGPTPAANRPE